MVHQTIALQPGAPQLAEVTQPGVRHAARLRASAHVPARNLRLHDRGDRIGQERGQEVRPLGHHMLGVSVQQDVADDHRAFCGRAEPGCGLDRVDLVTRGEPEFFRCDVRITNGNSADDGAWPYVREVSGYAVGSRLGQHRHVRDEDDVLGRTM